MFEAYYSKEACGLVQWSRTENNRIKASRIFKVAQSIEERFREHHRGIVNDPYHWASAALVIPPPPVRKGLTDGNMRKGGHCHKTSPGRCCLKCDAEPSRGWEEDEYGNFNKPSARIFKRP